MSKKSKKSRAENPQQEPVTQSESPVENISERELIFDSEFLKDLTYWVKTNRKIALRLLSLIEEIRRNPFSGTGKPERLKYQDVNNLWSRRLTEADRIVYMVSENRIDFLQARYHYSDRGK